MQVRQDGVELPPERAVHGVHFLGAAEHQVGDAVGDVELDAQNPRKLAGKEGKGVYLNGKGSKNLYTKQKFADVELHLEFNLPKGSNSGVKFHGHYEVQLYDSFGKKELTGEDCGGIYPRAESAPFYKYLDKGIPPKVNACKPPGQWQTLQVVFIAPRFDAEGKKNKNARIAKALLNEPQLLLLDEPTASLDPSAAQLIRVKIQSLATQSHCGILWTSHNMNEVEAVCDRVLFLSRGKVLLEGDPRTLPQEHGSATLEDLFIRVAREPLSAVATCVTSCRSDEAHCIKTVSVERVVAAAVELLPAQLPSEVGRLPQYISSDIQLVEDLQAVVGAAGSS